MTFMMISLVLTKMWAVNVLSSQQQVGNVRKKTDDETRKIESRCVSFHLQTSTRPVAGSATRKRGFAYVTTLEENGLTVSADLGSLYPTNKSLDKA
jgi:hypothetical protein